MIRLRLRQLLPLLVVALVGVSARASGPVFWTVATAADFLRGTSDGVYVSRDGVVTPGPQLTRRLTSAPAQVWSLAEAADGTLWAGTGGDGRLLRVRPGQPEETAFDADESNIFAVTAAGSRVYAASSPDGRVYVIDGTQPARAFFDPQEKYIWALAVAADGRLWVGAGNPAVIYRVEANGTGQVVYRPPAAHVVSLAGRCERPHDGGHRVARAPLPLRRRRSPVRHARLGPDGNSRDRHRPGGRGVCRGGRPRR